jgi:hypothetical protein
MSVSKKLTDENMKKLNDGYHETRREKRSDTPRRSLSLQERRELADASHVLGAHVGPYKIASIGNGKVYVGHECGEGGVFTVEQLLPYIEEFFREHF